MLNRTIAKYLFYFVAIVTLLWTGSLTYSFLTTALPGAFWAVPLASWWHRDGEGIKPPALERITQMCYNDCV